MVKLKKYWWYLIALLFSFIAGYILYWLIPVWIFGASKVIFVYKIIFVVFSCIVVFMLIFEQGSNEDYNNIFTIIRKR
jgi:hypothetical protein